MILDLKKLDIVPFTKVGPVSFNLSAKEIIDLLGEPNKKFYKSLLFPDRETFAYDRFGFHACFDKYLKLNALEFYEPANLVLFDKELFKLSFDDLIKLFKEKDPSTTEDDDGFIAKQSGIAAYVPVKEFYHTIPVEGILVYRDIDYYEQKD